VLFVVGVVIVILEVKALKRVLSKIALVLLLIGVLASVFGVVPIVAEEPVVIRARVDFKPDVLLIRGGREWVTCYIELPAGYRIRTIEVSSIMLNRSIPAGRPITLGDYDNDGVPDLGVTFDRASVIRFILRNIRGGEMLNTRFAPVALTITGRLIDGTFFRGTDTIRFVNVAQPA